MSVTGKRGTWILAGTLWALGSGIPAFADDTELFVSSANPSTTTIQPNILFVIDTSGSMRSAVVTQATYDPAVSYSGSCSTSRVYWRTGTGDPPSCDTTRWFNRDALMCDAGLQALVSGAGRYTDRMSQYDGSYDDRWEQLRTSTKSRLAECEDDSGVHGDGSNDKVYAQDGDSSQPWSNNSLDEVAWGQYPTDSVYTVYDGNYLNWYKHG